MALVGILILLFAAWMLWGWLVGEHREIIWMRNWCATLFVITALLISGGAGVGVTIAISRSRHRADVRNFAEALEKQLAAGKYQEAKNSLQSVINTPDEWSDDSHDLLERMTTVTARMQQSPSIRAAATESAVRSR